MNSAYSIAIYVFVPYNYHHIPGAMGGCIIAVGSVPHLGCNMTELWRQLTSFHHHSLNCVWQLATTQVALAILGLVAILVGRYVRSPWRHVPPGPRGLPIIGNALALRDKSWLLGRECKLKYSALCFSLTWP